MKQIYQVAAIDEDNTYLVNASSPEAAKAWVAENEGLLVEEVESDYECSLAVVNEAA